MKYLASKLSNCALNGIKNFWTWISMFGILVSIVASLFVALVGFAIFVVAVGDNQSSMYASLFDLEKFKNPKYEILKFLGFIMGGTLLVLQALISYKRVKSMDETARAQADAVSEHAKANQNTEKGQRQERLKNAIEHLGHESVSVRLGGAYELFHLAQDTFDLRKTVLEILCAHIRRTTGEYEYRQQHTTNPSEEVQSLLTLLFVKEYKVFKGLSANLQGSWLKGADLSEAQLENSNMIDVHIQGAELTNANLKMAQLMKTHMQRSKLYDANLQGATLMFTRMEGAFLYGAQLQAASLYRVHLQEAHLWQAQLQGVAQHSGESSLSEKIMEAVDRESDLSEVIFSGGLSREDVDLFTSDLPEGQVADWRKKLERHIDISANHQPPSCTIAGAYTQEEAEKWIADHEWTTSGILM